MQVNIANPRFSGYFALTYTGQVYQNPQEKEQGFTPDFEKFSTLKHQVSSLETTNNRFQFTHHSSAQRHLSVVFFDDRDHHVLEVLKANGAQPEAEKKVPVASIPGAWVYYCPQVVTRSEFSKSNAEQNTPEYSSYRAQLSQRIYQLQDDTIADIVNDIQL